MKTQIETKQDISRKEALKKIGNYGKYAALTALGTYMILDPQKAQASSPANPGDSFNRGRTRKTSPKTSPKRSPKRSTRR